MRNLTMIVLALILTSCAVPIPKTLYGQWVHTSHWRSKDQDIEVDITIHPDHTVTGNIGQATLENCVLRSNRGAIGRKLNIKSDFIIADGSIEGKVSDLDDQNHRLFTLPFDLEDGELVGSIMIVAPWTYPKPLLSRLYLKPVKSGSQ